MQSQTLRCDSQLSSCLIRLVPGNSRFKCLVLSSYLSPCCQVQAKPGSKSARSFQLECEYTNYLIKPGPPRTQTRRQDTLTTLDRKRNTKNTAGALPLARVLPGTSRSRSCNAYGRSKEAGNLAQACTQGWPVSSLYCKTNGTCYMRQIISTIFLLYFEEDWYFYFSFDHSPKRQGEKSGAVKSGHIY